MTKEVLASLESRASVALMDSLVCSAIRAMPDTPELQALTVPQVRLEPRENLAYPDCLDKRVCLVTFPRRETEDIRVFRDPLAPLVPLERLVMMESLG